MPQKVQKQPLIAVIGAGTMGAGIAQVALTAGCPVQLFDVSADMLAQAASRIELQLNRQADKGRLSHALVSTALNQLQTVTDLGQLAEADVVIEAVPERLELKRSLFRDLDEICRPDAILASNTSSLSITVLAAVTKHPERVVGLHFFNPAPVMKLVEVIVGEDTAESVVKTMTGLASAWGKEPIVCQDTPGFIVNRVARNFYGESLRIVAEGTASIETVDALMVTAAGFKMGPFRLMDLIGIDVNYDVTQAVYEAYHGEPRYRPHPIQARQVMSGRLGQKTGRGFYRYEDGTDEAQHQNAEPYASATAPRVKEPGRNSIAVLGNTPLVGRLAERLPEGSRGASLFVDTASSVRNSLALRWRCDEIEAFLRKHRPTCVFVSLAGSKKMLRMLLQSVEHAVSQQTVIFVSIAGPSATEQASWLSCPERVRGFAWLGERDAVEWTRPLQVEPPAEANFDGVSLAALGALAFQPVQIRDGAGGVTYRILSMILNEAVEVIREGTALPGAIDVAMRYGTNYPKGPAAWMDELSLLPVLATLEALSSDLGDDRYRASALLRARVQAGRFGGPSAPGWHKAT